MLIDSATSAVFDRIAQRAADAKMAFTPGAAPTRGDVATEKPESHFALDPLSVAAPENAYFITTDGRGRRCYTRDGSFALHDATLVGSNGKPMLGFVTQNGPLVQLRVDSVDEALGRARMLRVEADGTVAYDRAAVDPRSGGQETQRVVVGQLALARFAAGTKLVTVDANHLAAPPDEPPHIGRPADENFGTLTAFAREDSRVDLDASLQKLKDAYLAFDALQAAHKAKGHLGKTAMDLLK